MSKRVFIVIPAYNETAVLRQTVEELLPLGFTIVVVDDGSYFPQALHLTGLPVVCLRHVVNLGQGAALQTGMAYAREAGGDAVVHFDADGQHSPSDIASLLAALDTGADVALGSRFLCRDDASQIPRGRRLLLRLGRFVNGLFTGLWLTDAHNGLRALNKRALERIDLTENRMAHATEILSQIRREKLAVKEVPVTIRYTDYSQKKGQKWSNSINILIDVILNKWL